MPHQTCTVCSHPDRAKIDEALQNGIPPERELAKQVGIHHASLHRHKAHIVPVSGRAVKEIGTEIVKLRRMLARAKQKHDTPGVLSISREIRAWVTLEARTRDVKTSDAGNVEEISRADAVAMARLIIEAEVTARSGDIVEWLQTLLERAQDVNKGEIEHVLAEPDKPDEV